MVDSPKQPDWKRFTLYFGFATFLVSFFLPAVLGSYVQSTVMPQNGESFIRMMRSIGYDDDYFAKRDYEFFPANVIHPVLEKLLHDSSFVQGLQQAPSFAEPFSLDHLRSALPLEYLYELAAIRQREWSYFQRISPNATYSYGKQPYSLRFTCELNIAVNVHETARCKGLVNRPLSQAQCMHDLSAILAAEAHKQDQPLVQYSQEAFPRAEEFQEALRALGYKRGLNWLQLYKPLDEEYEEYFWKLARGQFTWPYAQRIASERQEFLNRVLAMK